MKHRLAHAITMGFGILVFIGTVYAAAPIRDTSQTGSNTVLSGNVNDAKTGDALVGALVKLTSGTYIRGFRTNSDGGYRAVVPPGKYRVEVSYLGYETVSQDLSIYLPFVQNFLLNEGTVVAREIEVSADEDFATTIVKRAIRYKKLQRDSLFTYVLEGYTKRTLKSDSTIASLTETYAKAFWRKGDTLREVIVQERLTENIKSQLRSAGNVLPAGIGRIIDFSEERVRIFSNRFVSPIAEDAFDFYRYELQSTAKVGESEIYTLKLLPQNKFVPLFNGTIRIDNKKYALVGIDVTPSQGFKLPYIKSLSLAYKQTQELQQDSTGNEVWLPATQSLDGGLKVVVGGGLLELPRISFTQSTVIYRHDVNVAVPETLFVQKLVQKSPSAERYDSLFWRENQVLIPTIEEETAYRTIDSTATFEEQFRPRGAATNLAGDAAGFLFTVPEIRYNRVEGWFLGAKYKLDSLTNTTSLFPEIGYGIERREVLWSLTLEQWLDSKRKFSLFGSAFHRTTFTPEHQSPPNLFNTYAAFFNPLSKRDYHNYFNALGWNSGIRYVFSNSGLRLSMMYQSQLERSMEKVTDFSLFIRDEPFRDNPAVTEGQSRSLTFLLNYGNRISLLGITSPYYARFEVEHSSEAIGSDFDFTRVWFVGSLIKRTFYTERFLAPYLFLQVEAGANLGGGILPPQRYYSIDALISGLGTIGAMYGLLEKELLGTAVLSTVIEHNFQSVPFEALGWDAIADENIQLLIRTGMAQVWLMDNTKRYAEVGLGIGGIFGLFRAYGVMSFQDQRIPRLGMVFMGSILF